MFLDIWHRIANWFQSRRRRLPASAAVAPPAIATPPEEAARPAAPVVDKAAREIEVALYYEKQRRKHDKFVTPQGELPTREPKPRPVTQEVKPRLPKPPDVVPAVTPESLSLDDPIGCMVETHHEGGSKVLYKGSEALGEFNFRDTILEQLDRYFFYLRRMKKHDSDAYGLYREVGATLLPYLATGSWKRTKDERKGPKPIMPLPAWFNAQRPGFGCFAYGADPETEKFEQTKCDRCKEMWVPKFMYFQKYSVPPFDVQPTSGGDVYRLTVWWDRPSKKVKHGIPQSFPIFISKDGKTVRALKTLKTKLIPIPSKHGAVHIPSRAWRIPNEYEEWAKEHDEDVQHFLTGVFVDSVIHAEQSHMSMTRIAVTKNRMTAVFSVNIRRTAYFFQDRDISVTQRGSRQRVFHLVRPHVRKDGTAVKMHFRGVRDFTWAGYDVHISVPGLDHADISEFDIGAVDEAMIEDKSDAITTPEMGKMLADHMRSGWAA